MLSINQAYPKSGSRLPRKQISKAIPLILLAGFLALLLNTLSVEAAHIDYLGASSSAHYLERSSAVWAVGPPGSGADFCRIQDAVNAASNTDTIQVWSGIYTENVVVNKSVSLCGSGKDGTLVNALNPNSHVFDIQADSVSLAGFKIVNSTGNAGIHSSNVRFLSISHDQIEFNKIGVWLDFYSEKCTVLGNRIANNSLSGFQLSNSANNSISDNEITANGGGIDFLYGSRYNSISGNNISGNYFGIWLFESPYNLISSNSITKNGHGIGTDDYFPGSSNLIWNNFFSNDVNAQDSFYGFNNWNVSKMSGVNIVGGPYLGGNYWSDYAGADLDGDGLGDTFIPYKSNGSILNGGDWHPLVSPSLQISTYTDKYNYSFGDAMHIGLNISNAGSQMNVCFAVWVARPGHLNYLYMHLHNVTLPANFSYSNPSWQIITLPSLPRGSYVWHVAFLNPSSHAIIAESTAKWQIK